MISLIHLLSIKARPLPPLSQEQGGIDTETVATTRFAALLPVYAGVNRKINWGIACAAQEIGDRVKSRRTPAGQKKSRLVLATRLDSWNEGLSSSLVQRTLVKLFE